MGLEMMLHSIAILVLVTIPVSGAALDVHYYDDSCPQAEGIIDQVVRNAIASNPKVTAQVLRLFFHDCFIRGCDASVLLDSTQDNQAEKAGPPNLSLGSFYVIDEAKAKIEEVCPKTVSCADVLAIAARDVVVQSGGPDWNVSKGRKDGRTSNANETVKLPSPFSNASQLILGFSQRGLDTKDLVALSGGHTLGFSHCSSFSRRLNNFSPAHFSDPTLDSSFASVLRRNCPVNNKDRNAGQLLDSTASVFDNNYFKMVLEGKGVFASDQSLLSEKGTARLVEAFAGDQTLFFKRFAKSMLNLGDVGVTQDGEVRKNCRLIN